MKSFVKNWSLEVKKSLETNITWDSFEVCLFFFFLEVRPPLSDVQKKNSRLQVEPDILGKKKTKKKKQEAELTQRSDLPQAVSWWTVKTCAVVDKKISSGEQKH